MANVVDYLHWRGDLTFDNDPFNNVDNLILSILSYLGFGGVIPSERSEKRVQLGDACSKILKKLKNDPSIIAGFSRQPTRVPSVPLNETNICPVGR